MLIRLSINSLIFLIACSLFPIQVLAECGFKLTYISPQTSSKEYKLLDVREFVAIEVRPRLTQSEYRETIKILRTCDNSIASIDVQIHTDNYYITNINRHEVDESVYKYDEQNIIINKIAFEQAFDDSLNFQNLTKNRQKEILKIFAYIFAESARFSVIEERLDNIFKSNCRVNWSESKTLFRRWARLSTFEKEAGISDHRFVGGKNNNLFSPISINVIQAYEAEALNGNSHNRLDNFIDPRDFGKKLEWDSPACGDNSLTMREERDNILMLLAYSVVLNDWQQESVVNRRGHNIGSILVDANGIPIFWSRNANKVLNDATQHGEVRLIQNYLNCTGVGEYADGLTVYTTLEPCAMCSGMMTLTQVSRVVYGQTDPGYGNSAKALISIHYPGMYEDVSLDINTVKQSLDKAYSEDMPRYKSSITSFLISDRAQAIYQLASKQLDTFTVQYQQNKKILDTALAFKAAAQKEDPALGLRANCPQ